MVFFDKEVSRTWVNAVCIRNFSCDDDPEDMGKVSLATTVRVFSCNVVWLVFWRNPLVKLYYMRAEIP